MFRKHYSDDQLLALTDGELSGRQANSVTRHLASCWRCRARQQELESAAQQLARLFDAPGYPEAGWLEPARGRLLASIAEVESASILPMTRRSAQGWWRWVLIPAACLAAAASVYVGSRSLLIRTPEPVEVPRKPEASRTSHAIAPVVPGAPAPPAREPTSKPAEIGVRLTPLVPTAGELISAEVEADYALHRIGACTRETMEAAALPEGRIEVRGVVETTTRKAEIEANLAPIPFLRVHLQSVDQMAGSAATIPPEPIATVRPSALPLQKRLESHFSGSGNRTRAIAEFANRTMELSASVRLEAWILARLAEKYPAGRTRELTAPASWLLEDMIREHAGQLHLRSAELLAHLSPVFGDAPATQLSDSSADSAETPVEMVRASTEIYAAALGLFAGGPPLESDPDASVQNLMLRAARIRSASQLVEQTAHGILHRREERARNAVHKY